MVEMVSEETLVVTELVMIMGTLSVVTFSDEGSSAPR